MRILYCFLAVISVIISANAAVPDRPSSGIRGNFEITGSQDRNSITGFVFGEGRTPMSRIYVELQTDMYSTLGRAQTNGSGMFSFNGLAAGQYVLKVLTGGTDYESSSMAVSLIPVSAIRGRGSVSEQVDFHLKLRSRGVQATGSPAVIFAQDVPAEAKELYEAGIDDIAKLKDNEGLEKLKRSIEIFPTYYYALDRLGNEYVARGHFQAAAVLLKQSVEVNPRSYTSLFGLGLAEFRLNRLKEAAELFQSALVVDKESANANLWLGITLHAQGKFSDSVNALKKANSLSKGSVAEVHWQLARVYKDQNRFKEAASELELFLKYKPDAANAEEVRKIIGVLKAKT